MQQLNHRLQEADSLKDEFRAVLRHEIRNPLAAVANAASLLRDGRLDAAETTSVHEMSGRQLRHARRLLDHLPDVARVTRGKVSLAKTRLDLVALVCRAADALRPPPTRNGTA